MKPRWTRAFALAALAGSALLSGCASDQPYSAPQQSPNRTLPRAPVVAPSGPSSPWWWPLYDSWWPFQ